MSDTPTTRASLVAAADAVARSYASILFSRSRVVGLLLCAATLTSPRLFAFGLLSVLWANLVARLLKLDEHALTEGQFGYNALLVGLGVAATFAGLMPAVPVLMLAVVGTVLLTAAFRASLGASGLPSLSLPFLAVYYLLLSASPLTHLPFGPYAVDPWHDASWVPGPLALFLRSLGALFFLPRLDAGLLVLLALVVHSRISTILATVAFAAVLQLDAHVLSLPEGSMLHVLGYNTMLTAVGLGGVWFVPSRTSLSLSLVGVLLCVMVTVGSMPPLARMGIPAMILPFNVTSILMLYAMRQRSRDGSPKAAFSLQSTPEGIVDEHRSHTARFFALHAVRFRLPLRGFWVCTQGNDGPFTHQGAWRHGLDFEVKGRDGKLFEGAGTSVRDHLAYGLPVLAAADGVVAKVVDGHPDNPVGEMDLVHNWGNVIVVYHAPGLYSLVAHLAPGSIKVREGQAVRAGEQIAACGSSGRSPRPHLHFQLQATHLVGAPTLPVHFHHVITAGPPHTMARSLRPEEGDELRSVEADASVAAFFHLPLGTTMLFEVDGVRESIVSEVGLLGELYLRSVETGAVLTYEAGEALMVVLDARGPSRSVLHLAYAALPRAPYDGETGLQWTDVLPRQRFRGLLARVAADALSLVVERDGVEMRYTMQRSGERLIVAGESLETLDERPMLSTRVELEAHAGITRVEVTHHGKTRRAVRASPPPPGHMTIAGTP